MLNILYFGDILLILVDIALIWLDFYNYMLLNKICVLIEIVIHILTSLIAISHIQRGLESTETSNGVVVLFIL